MLPSVRTLWAGEKGGKHHQPQQQQQTQQHWWGSWLPQPEANSTEEERAIERRRLWTHDFATCVFTLWDLRRKLALRAALNDCDDLIERNVFPEVEEKGHEAALLGFSDAIKTDRLVDRRRRVRNDIDDRFPGLFSRDDRGAGTYAQFGQVTQDQDKVQMIKDFARETVLVGGLRCEPSPQLNQYEAVRATVKRALAAASTDEVSAELLADAAMRASWRTKVGAEAWEHAVNLKCRLHCNNHAAYALVSRPTEPVTTMAIYPHRVVVTVHSHLCEVKCDEDEVNSPHARSWWTSRRQHDRRHLRCGEERAFFSVTSRTTAVVLQNGTAKLHMKKCLLSVVLLAYVASCWRHSFT